MDTPALTVFHYSNEHKLSQIHSDAMMRNKSASLIPE